MSRIRQSIHRFCTLFLLPLGACASGVHGRQTSSAVDYLYPGRKDVAIQPAVPVLRLPLKVGVAFTPESEGSRSSRGQSFSEKDKLDLMREISERFRRQPYVRSIELIPSSYLSPRGGFANVDQLRTMFGLDVLVLLSYDQIQFSDETKLGVTYLSIVGAYLINGQKNDTRTLMEAVVYDIPSRTLLFRAPGLSQVRGTSAPVNQTLKLRADMDRSFREAAEDLATNLESELGRFAERVKESPEQVRVVETAAYEAARARSARSGGTGGGSSGALLGLGVVLLVGASTAIRSRSRGGRNA